MSFLHGLNYLYRSFVLFAGLVVTIYTLATSIGSSVFDHLISIQTAALCLVLLVTDFYRQRFYLDWRSEWGLHWRVAVLHLAKWPYMLLALGDVLLNRRVPYAITPKVRTKPRRMRLFVPHVLLALVVACAWGFGVGLDLDVSDKARKFAGVFIVCTLGLVVSDLLPTPEPFDRGRFRRWRLATEKARPRSAPEVN
jgi:hypothetical protein